MSKKIIIIGGGPGGYIAAIRAAGLGGKVTVVEQENLGGTCLNWGCIPSKIMKNSAEIFLKCLNAKEFGVDVQGQVTPNMPTLIQRKEKILDSQRQGIENLLKSRGVALEKGRAEITDHGIVTVIFPDNREKRLNYDRLIIATGTTPMNVDSFPFDGKKILSSNDMLVLDKVPDSLTIVGGGVIGCEFAFIFSALGCDVTIVEAMSRLLPLPSVDADVSKLLLREMKKRKIKVLCDTVVAGADTIEDNVTIALKISPFTDNPVAKPPKLDKISSQLMAVCIGRTPLSKDLGLDNIGLETHGPGWISVDDHMRTSVSNVYAIGDILGPEKIMLAHVASHEGLVAAENAMGMECKMSYRAVPSAIFTMPEISSVGLSEAQAIEQGIDVKIATVNFRVLGKAQAIGEIAGEAKMIIEQDSHRVVGVHMIGPHATDLISEATMAVENGTTAEEIAHMIHAHPTLSEIMGEVASKAVDMPLHG